MLTVRTKRRSIADRLHHHLTKYYGGGDRITKYRFLEDSHLSKCRHQYDVGSCSFVSVVAAVEFLYRIFNLPVHNTKVKRFYFDLQEIFDNLYVKFDSIEKASAFRADVKNSDGTPVELVLEYVVRYGLQATTIFRDLVERDTLSCFNPNAHKYKIKRYEVLTRDDVIHWAGVFPLIGMFYSYSSLTSYKEAVYAGPDDHEKQWKPDCNHSVLVVGIFQDKTSLQHFIVIQNSYGIGYGFCGFLAMPLDCQDLFHHFVLPILDDTMEKRISSLTPPPMQMVSRSISYFQSGLCTGGGNLKSIRVANFDINVINDVKVWAKATLNIYTNKEVRTHEPKREENHSPYTRFDLSGGLAVGEGGVDLASVGLYCDLAGYYSEEVHDLSDLRHAYLKNWTRSAESDDRLLFRAAAEPMVRNKVFLCEIKDDEEITIPAGHKDYDFETENEDDHSPDRWTGNDLTEGFASSSTDINCGSAVGMV